MSNKDDFDYAAFWSENASCMKPFSVDKPRAPLCFILEDHFVTHLVDMPSTLPYYTDPAFTLATHVRANDILEREIGLRYYPENHTYHVKGAFEVAMGARRVLNEGNTPWLEPAIQTPADLAALIRRAEGMDDMRRAIPDEWLEARERLLRATGQKLLFAHGLNGPATMMCNLLGTLNTCLFIMEEPELMDEFVRVITPRYIAFQEAALMLDHGHVSRAGVGVNDDNCHLFPPAQYERFCAPMLARIFDAFAPLPGHTRRQHSDSAMGHLMPILNSLGVNEVNFGPELDPAAIRAALPRAVIHGHTPPFLLRNGTPAQIAARVRRNFEILGADGGYVESLAGVMPESTPFENIRAYIRATHELTRL